MERPLGPVAAVLRQRCPRCRRGAVFGGFLRMHRECPACGLRFEREPGYFLGAMYFSYGGAILAGVPTFLLMWRRGAEPFSIGVAVTLTIAACAPLLFRYARILWLHFDQAFDPR